jgi:hypothetical protein
MSRPSRREMRALADDQEYGARQHDEGAADARRHLANPNIGERDRAVTQAALKVHVQNARELRENASALRDGRIPGEDW